MDFVTAGILIVLKIQTEQLLLAIVFILPFSLNPIMLGAGNESVTPMLFTLAQITPWNYVWNSAFGDLEQHFGDTDQRRCNRYHLGRSCRRKNSDKAD